jgi:hypothetical protein
MPVVTLRIEPEFCGSMSMGTVRIIKLLAECFELSIAAAEQHVDRCVFDGEAVEIVAPSADAAARFVAATAALPAVPRVLVGVREA